MPAWLNTLIGYPGGITTGNMIASLMWVAFAALMVWIFKDVIGRKLVAWFHKHYKAHLAQLEAEAKKLEKEL